MHLVFYNFELFYLIADSPSTLKKHSTELDLLAEKINLIIKYIYIIKRKLVSVLLGRGLIFHLKAMKDL